MEIATLRKCLARCIAEFRFRDIARHVPYEEEMCKTIEGLLLKFHYRSEDVH